MKDRPDESMTTRRLSRRDFLGRAAAVAALTGVAGPLAACQPPEETGGAAGTDLDFVIWSYNVGTVQDNVNQFQKTYPQRLLMECLPRDNGQPVRFSDADGCGIQRR
jgi:hypothetical protein